MRTKLLLPCLGVCFLTAGCLSHAQGESEDQSQIISSVQKDLALTLPSRYTVLSMQRLDQDFVGNHGFTVALRARSQEVDNMFRSAGYTAIEPYVNTGVNACNSDFIKSWKAKIPEISCEKLMEVKDPTIADSHYGQARRWWATTYRQQLPEQQALVIFIESPT